MLKRLSDIVASTTALVIFSPVLASIALWIKLDSPGPVFYRGRRAGQFGRPFRIFKFRSMVTNADKIGGSSTSDVDPRITRVGRFVRKYKLDELPQLLNVLVGDMSLVGPRPQVCDYVERYNDEEKQVLQLRPGITDWASIWNSDEGAVLAGHPDPDKAYDELIHPTKMKLQLVYARHHSLAVDLKIIFCTLARMLWKNWTPSEIRGYPKPGAAPASTGAAAGFETVTELPGAGATAEQLAMLYTRYGWAGELASGKDILEVACGSGIGLGYLAQRAKHVVAGDFDPKLADLARRQHGGRLDVRCMNAESLPFADASFDIVLLLEAIYYLPNPEAFVREARRVLRPDGTLLINSANCERPDFNPSPFSTQYYSAGDLQRLLEENGFEAEVFGGFPLAPRGAADHIRQACRHVAVKLRLIPKTMKWKRVFKRMFFGKLKPLPTILSGELPAADPLIRVDGSRPVPDYKVLYAVAKRRVAKQRQAA